MPRSLRIVLILAFFPPLVAAVMGWIVAPNFLHPERRLLSAPREPNGLWVLMFHSVADNRVGVIGQAEMLLGPATGW
jgi:hypothetical protein